MKDKKISLLADSHTKKAIHDRIMKGPRHYYMRDFIFGAIDGLVTTFAIVAGVYGANLSSAIIIILGLANVCADGFSMAVSNYLGTKADESLLMQAKEEEAYHIKTVPEGEKEEIRQIFQAKGFEGEQLETIVAAITSDQRLWIDTMLKEELGISPLSHSPFRAAVSTFFAFLFAGFLPLIAFIFQFFFPYEFDPFYISALLTALAFFIIGALKGNFVGKKWFMSGLETLIMGSIAVTLAFIIGLSLKNFR